MTHVIKIVTNTNFLWSGVRVILLCVRGINVETLSNMSSCFWTCGWFLVCWSLSLWSFGSTDVLPAHEYFQFIMITPSGLKSKNISFISFIYRAEESITNLNPNQKKFRSKRWSSQFKYFCVIYNIDYKPSCAGIVLNVDLILTTIIKNVLQK